MARTCYLAGIDANIVPIFGAVFKSAGEPAPAALAHLDVSELGRLAPGLLAKNSTAQSLAARLRGALATVCSIDPRFAA
jgi:hypothetical protein